MKTVHVAGLLVEVEGRVIQRCAICGLKLIDSKNTMVPVEDAGKPFPAWEVHSLVVQDGNQSSVMQPESISDGFKIPENFCIDLVED